MEREFIIINGQKVNRALKVISTHSVWFMFISESLCDFLFGTKNLLAFDKQNYTFKLIDHNNSFGNINTDNEVVR